MTFNTRHSSLEETCAAVSVMDRTTAVTATPTAGCRDGSKTAWTRVAPSFGSPGRGARSAVSAWGGEPPAPLAVPPPHRPGSALAAPWQTASGPPGKQLLGEAQTLVIIIIIIITDPNPSSTLFTSARLLGK